MLGLSLSLSLGAGGRSRSYVGQVATRSFVPNNRTTGHKQLMARTRHVARDDIFRLRLAYPNWTVLTGVETDGGAVATVRASIEYPEGVFTQVLFSGSAAGTIADGATGLSDWVDVTIPNGATFFVRTWRDCAGGIIYCTNTAQDVAGGDFFRYGTTTSDLTMGGAIVSSDTTNCHFPAAILASTVKSSVAILGDSRAWGQGDDWTTGDRGELAKAIGPSLGYINLSNPGDRAMWFAPSGTKRSAVAAYCSHAVVQYGINDVANSRTDAQIQADINTIRSGLPMGSVYLSTMPPGMINSTDNWATLANQSPPARDVQRIANNDWRRAVPSGFVGCVEVADAVESARNSGKWVVNGSANYATSDGTHETPAGYQLIKDSGLVNPASFVR